MAPTPRQLAPVKPIHVLESDYRKAVYEKPSDIFALTALAQLLADLGRHDEAARHFEKAISLDTDADDSPIDSCCYEEAVGLAMGWYAALVEGNGAEGLAKAEGLYEMALALNPRDCLSMGNYAVFLHRIKRDYTAAAVAYKKAIKVHPTHASILCKYGSFVKHVENDHDKARGLFEAAIAANPCHAESLGNLAVLLHGQAPEEIKVLDRIEDLYKRAVHSDPTNANNFSNYGLFLAEMRADVAGAEVLYKRAGDIDPLHANSIYNYAVLLDSSLKQHERAEIMYRRCLEVNPEHSYALYNLAVLREEHTKDGDYSEAKQLFERAVRVSPADALTRADYGRFLALVEKDFNGALENLREAMRCDPDCTAAQFNLGKLLLHRQHPAQHCEGAGASMGLRNKVSAETREAKDLLRRVLRAKKEHPGANLSLARVLIEEGDVGGAMKHCEAALSGKCTDVESMAELAAALGRKGRSNMAIERAKELFERAKHLAPRDACLLRQHSAFLNEVESQANAISDTSNKDGNASSSNDLLTAKVSRLSSPPPPAYSSADENGPRRTRVHGGGMSCSDSTSRQKGGSSGEVNEACAYRGGATVGRCGRRRASS